jgi:SH3 domain protein
MNRTPPAAVRIAQNLEVPVNKILVLLVGLLTLDVAAAETRYITDQTTVPVRSGATSGHRITRTLATGTPVQVRSIDTKTGYSLVRLDGGVEGYVLTSQLQEDPPARERLAAAQAKLAELQQAPDQLATQLASLRTEHSTLKTDYEQVKADKQRLEQELATIKHTSANAVRIAEERNELRTTVATLTRQNEEIKQQSRDRDSHDAQRWFLIGGGVTVVGVLLGLILPRLRFQRRKSSWSSL